MKLEWDFNSGGSNGPNMLLRLDGNCVGHFYEDAAAAIDADEVREDIATRYNAHGALVAALEACIEEINDLAHEIAENGGITFDHDAPWPAGSAVAQARSALALART